MKLSSAFPYIILSVMAVTLISCSKNKKADSPGADTLNTALVNNSFQTDPGTPDYTCMAYILGSLKKGQESFLILDTLQWFNGDAAKTAFDHDRKKMGLQSSKFTDAFYIRNPAVESLRVKVSGSANVIMQTFSRDNSGNFRFNEKIEAGSFIKLLASKDTRLTGLKPYELVVKNNEIVSIKEKYIP